jgi:hypothetical protein
MVGKRFDLKTKRYVLQWLGTSSKRGGEEGFSLGLVR